MLLEKTLKELILKHRFDTIDGKSINHLLATPSIPDTKIVDSIPLRSLFFPTGYTLQLLSTRKLKNIYKLWRIPKGYQRHFVKDEKQQQQLLLALLLGEVNSQFIFGVTPNTLDMDVIDSQQRLTILKKFFDNKLALPKKAILKFIGHDEGRTINCSNMYYSDFDNHPIYKLLIDTILDGVKCETIVHEGPVELHVGVFTSLNTGNTALSLMEEITAQPYDVFKYARTFNNFGIEYDNVGDSNWDKLNEMWSIAGLSGLRYEQAKLVLQCLCFEKYGWNNNISKNHIIEYAKTEKISKSWKDIFEIFIKLHTDIIKKKSDYENKDLWGLQGWRVFLSFIRFLYRQDESIKIVVKDYTKFWLFAQDIMKNLRTTLGYNDTMGEHNFDIMKKHPSTNKQLIVDLVKEFEKMFSNAKSHDEFLENTGISVRDGKRAIDWKIASLVWQLQDGKCAGCGIRVSVNNDKDHKIKWADGGKGNVDNVQILCDGCHTEEKKKTFMINDDFDDFNDIDDIDDNDD